MSNLDSGLQIQAELWSLRILVEAMLVIQAGDHGRVQFIDRLNSALLGRVDKFTIPNATADEASQIRQLMRQHCAEQLDSARAALKLGEHGPRSPGQA